MSSSNLMDFIGAVTAAASAGKLPSTKQANDLANWLLKSPILQLEESAAGCGGKLSENGSTIMRDIREIIEAHQAVATEKNGDDILQKALFALGSASRQQQSQGGYGQQRLAQQESQDYVGAMRIAAEALLGSLDMSGQSLRQQEQGSYRDQMQVDEREITAARLSQALSRIAERAQNDQEYRRGIDTLFSIYDKFKTSSISGAQQYQQPSGNQLQEQLAQILGGGEMASGLKDMRNFIERFASGRSLEPVLSAAAVCAFSLLQDQEVRRAVDDWEAFIRRSLDEPSYIQSDQYRQRSTELRQQWEKLRERNSEAGRKWNQDVERVERESREFNQAVQQDRSVQRIRNAHLKLATHLSSVVENAGRLAQPSSFIMADSADVILPRALSMLQNIPLPRTEHVDQQQELVVDNLKIESLQLQPGNVNIQTTPEEGSDQAQKTRVQFKGVQMKLKPASFYYKDKTNSQAPSSGQLELKFPQKGLDLDLQVSLLPTGPSGKQREQRSSFLRVDQAKISLQDLQISSSQPCPSKLQPLLVKVLEGMFQQGITSAVGICDSVAFEVNKRAQIFADSSRLENMFGAHALAATGVIDRILRDHTIAPQVQQARPSEQQRVKGEGVPAESEGFLSLMARQVEVEQRSQGWRSEAYQLPAM